MSKTGPSRIYVADPWPQIGCPSLCSKVSYSRFGTRGLLRKYETARFSTPQLDQIESTRECISTGAAGAQTCRSLGHHLLHPLILSPRAPFYRTDFSHRSKFLAHSLTLKCIRANFTFLSRSEKLNQAETHFLSLSD